MSLDYRARGIVTDCPPEAQLRDEIRRSLASEPFGPFGAFGAFGAGNANQRRVEIEVLGSQRTLTGIVRFTSADNRIPNWSGEEQKLTSRPGHCVELTSAMALVVALSLERLQREPLASPQASGSESRGVPPPSALASDSVALSNPGAWSSRNGEPSSDLRPKPWVFLLGAGPSVGGWHTPTPTLGATFSSSAERSRFSIGAEISLCGSSSLLSAKGGGVALTRRQIQILACGRFDRAVYGCASFGLDSFSAHGVDLAAISRGQLLTPELGARVGVRLAQWGRFSARTDVGLTALLQTISASVSGASVWEQPTFGAIALVRLDARLFP